MAKFVVPDQAITPAGRIVQCGSCGNKWKQFPIKNEVSKITPDKNIVNRNVPETTKRKPKKIKKKREINLYSPEYLAKKHGISLNNIEAKKNNATNVKTSFGFYNSLIFFVVILIAFSRSLYFLQDFIITALPSTEFYLDYFFENIKNIFEIWKNLISSY